MNHLDIENCLEGKVITLPSHVGSVSYLDSMLKQDEGNRLRLYRCTSGKLTIGVGRNIQDCGITQEESDFLLKNDIKKVTQELLSYIPWTKKLDAARFDVLANMAFNLGINGLLKSKKTLEHFKNEEFELAAREMLRSTWATQVKDRAIRLASVTRTGKYDAYL